MFKLIGVVLTALAVLLIAAAVLYPGRALLGVIAVVATYIATYAVLGLAAWAQRRFAPNEPGMVPALVWATSATCAAVVWAVQGYTQYWFDTNWAYWYAGGAMLAIITSTVALLALLGPVFEAEERMHLER